MGSAICVQLRGLICRTSYFEPEDVLRHQSINIFEVVWILDFKFPGGQVAFGSVSKGCTWQTAAKSSRMPANWQLDMSG